MKSGSEGNYTQLQVKKNRQVKVMILKRGGKLLSWRSEHQTLDICCFHDYKVGMKNLMNFFICIKVYYCKLVLYKNQLFKFDTKNK